MEQLIMEAYRKAKNKDFFTITLQLERLLRKQYSLQDPRSWISTGEVRRILERQGLLFETD